MTTWLQKSNPKVKHRDSATVKKAEPVFDYRIIRIVINKMTCKSKSATHRCRVTPKHIYLANGEVYDGRSGVRVMPRTSRVWSHYRWSVDLLTLTKT